MPAAARQQAAPGSDDYAFLAGSLIDETTLKRAQALARLWQVDVHDVLLSQGWVEPRAYARALAGSCGAPLLTTSASARPGEQLPGSPRSHLAAGLLRSRGGVALDAAGRRPADVRSALAALAAAGSQPALMAAPDLRAEIARRCRRRLAADAVHDLSRRFPAESAAEGLTPPQMLVLAALLGFIGLGLALHGTATLAALAALATLFFALVTGLRVIACARLLQERVPEGQATAGRLPDPALPIYTVLVPLYREAPVLPRLLQALSRLDYPRAKLDIKLIMESGDEDTLAAVAALELPGNFEVVVVPRAGPRTKPKALNYALQFARGDYVAIYDAEDRPEPDQLRRVLAVFAASPPDLGCVQARLNFYNPTDNWLARQFTIEYSALFDGLLPTLDRLGLPIPLGGTSCHFRTVTLRWVGGWDPFNVTEDADLGMRLARRGYGCRVVDSTTYEEAACQLPNWLRQRTRWQKGWLQTYAVHMRHPARLWRELGPWRFLGFQAVVGGIVASALLHPLFYLLMAWQLTAHTLFAEPQGTLGWTFWALASANASLGYAAAMGLGLIAARRRGLCLARQVALMPVYWLLISLAAYRALVQVLYAPHEWEKTRHGLAQVADAAARERARQVCRRLPMARGASAAAP